MSKEETGTPTEPKLTSFATLVAAFIKALATVVEEIGVKAAIAAIENKGEQITQMFRLIFSALIRGQQLALVDDPKVAVEPEEAKPTILAYPADGEIFELTLDGDAPENQPLEMVERFGYNSKGWKHKGSTVSGKQTRRFKLVRAGNCNNLGEVAKKTSAHGKNQEGQWISAFKASYPQHDGNGPVGVADPSWVSPGGHAGFPCVRSFGEPGFYWAGHDLDDYWRWLVAVSE